MGMLSLDHGLPMVHPTMSARSRAVSQVAPGQTQLQASGTSLGMGQAPAGRPSSVGSMAGQGSRELEPRVAGVALLPLTAPGG